MPAACNTGIIRRYTKLKRRLKIANIVGIAFWLGMMQYFAITFFLFDGKDALAGEVVKGHYYLAKGSTRQDVTRGEFWFSWCSGIVFFVSAPICLVAALSTSAVTQEIKKIEPKLG